MYVSCWDSSDTNVLRAVPSSWEDYCNDDYIGPGPGTGFKSFDTAMLMERFTANGLARMAIDACVWCCRVAHIA